MRSSAPNIKGVSWGGKDLLCVYRNDSLYVDNPEMIQASTSEALTRTPTTVHFLTTFYLIYLFITYYLSI
jgi:hypothetical protein